MALISRFEERPLEPSRIHGPVLCGYKAVDIAGVRVLQMETYGSPDRAIPGKISQSLQLTQESARELKRILERSFPGL
jgi:hypothetical protein